MRCHGLRAGVFVVDRTGRPVMVIETLMVSVHVSGVLGLLLCFAACALRPVNLGAACLGMTFLVSLYAAVAVPFVERLTFDQRKVPFTCSYVPGAANLRLYWAAYLGAFLAYAVAATGLQRWVGHPPAILWCLATSLGLRT